MEHLNKNEGDTNILVAKMRMFLYNKRVSPMLICEVLSFAVASPSWAGFFIIKKEFFKVT